MLSHFELKNIALADYAEIDFVEGVNILSGETGSGKSVILDSINFVLGAKADRSMIRYGTTECSATATFVLPPDDPAHELLAELDADDETLIISRKYNLDGRGVIKINGVTVNASMLRRITARLVDVHGQSEHFSLLKEEEQLSVIDNYRSAEINEIKSKISPEISNLNEINSKIRALGGNESERAIRLDILKFQIREIEEASLTEGEEEVLTAKQRLLRNSEKIISSLSAAFDILSGESGASDSLSMAVHNLGQISKYGEEYAKLSDRLDSVSIELGDISDSISDCLGAFDFDKDEAEKVEKRLELIKNLKKKYGKDIKSILEFKENAVEECDRIENYEKQSEELFVKKAALKSKIYKYFLRLRELRQNSAAEFCKNVESELKELGMPKAVFKIKFNEFPREDELGDSLNAEGADAVEFMFSANLGEPLKPLAKIISGGEISRFMLAVRTQTARAQSISTFIFDEIDSGISGLIASVVAEKFAKIAVEKQIIAITHLPQIACMADNSLLIEKIEENGKTKTIVRNLAADERVLEITRLVGGTMSSKAAVAHANEMISAADKFKKSLNG